MNFKNHIFQKPLQGRLPGLSLLNMWFSPRKAINVKARRAFTLIEMMVAVSLFAIVMLVGVGSLLSLVQTNRRAQAINSVMNNLNAAVESMTRTMRVGTTYHCGTSGTIDSAQSCATGDTYIAFESASGNKSLATDQVVYRLNGHQIERSLSSGSSNSWVALTAPEVSIDTFTFYVVGAPTGDGIQPRVLMRLKGSAQVPGGTTNFTVQSGVVQRLLDL